MTPTSQGASPRGLTAPGTGSPGSFSPLFPAPIGATQFLGIRQAQGYRPSTWPPPAYA
jgi:hypothetical protein